MVENGFAAVDVVIVKISLVVVDVIDSARAVSIDEVSFCCGTSAAKATTLFSGLEETNSAEKYSCSKTTAPFRVRKNTSRLLQPSLIH